MSSRIHLLVLAVMACAASLAVSGSAPLAQASGLTPEARQNFIAAWARQPREDVGIPADGARVVILKFTDYECPGCRQTEQAYKPVLDKFATSHPGAIKYVVKDWPWNTACNFNAARTIPGHEASCEAAAAARMARDRGKADEMIGWLYANQGATPDAVRAAAVRMLGIADFDREYTVKVGEIRRDVAEGGVLQVNSTPAYFINGVRLPGIIPVELFELAITLELGPAR
jgi:protein-disulfide isomerase